MCTEINAKVAESSIETSRLDRQETIAVFEIDEVAEQWIFAVGLFRQAIENYALILSARE